MKITTLLSLASLFCLSTSPLQAVDYYWNINSTSSNPGDWGDTLNWDPDAGVPGSGGVNDRALLNRRELNSATKYLVLDADRTIGLLGVQYLPTARDTNFTVAYHLSGDHELTIGSTATPGKLYVGVSQVASAVTTATFQIGGGTGISLIGGEFLIGAQHDGATGKSQLTGTVQMRSQNARLDVGTQTNRSVWVLGHQTNGNNEWKSTGTFETAGTTPGGGHARIFL